MRKSVLSKEVRSALKKYAILFKKQDEAQAQVRAMMKAEGVYEDLEKLWEAVELLPSSYLKYNLHQAIFELKRKEEKDND